MLRFGWDPLWRCENEGVYYLCGFDRQFRNGRDAAKVLEQF